MLLQSRITFNADCVTSTPGRVCWWAVALWPFQLISQPFFPSPLDDAAGRAATGCFPESCPAGARTRLLLELGEEPSCTPAPRPPPTAEERCLYQAGDEPALLTGAGTGRETDEYAVLSAFKFQLQACRGYTYLH